MLGDAIIILFWSAPNLVCRPFEPYIRRIVEEAIIFESPEDLRGRTFPRHIMERIQLETRGGKEFVLGTKVSEDIYTIEAHIYRLQVHDVITVVHTNGQEESPTIVKQEGTRIGNILGTFEFLIGGPFLIRVSVRIRTEEIH